MRGQRVVELWMRTRLVYDNDDGGLYREFYDVKYEVRALVDYLSTLLEFCKAVADVSSSVQCNTDGLCKL